jgi:hypothetical protein
MANPEAQPDIRFDELVARMVAQRVKRLLVKELAPNDNSKNQPYLSSSLDVTNIIPTGPIELTESRSGSRILKARLDLAWLQPDGAAIAAPNAKLILYPQYPEVRLSGFLSGAVGAPSVILATREPGRLLFLGVTDTGRIVAWAGGAESKVAQTYRTFSHLELDGVFRVIPLLGAGESSRERLIRELKRIHEAGWIESRALRSDGTTVPCNSSQCVGYTLEAELGVARNGRSEPDFEGWEIKASQVPDIHVSSSRRILTLMTPEPTGGFYRSEGAENFVRKFGYADKRGRPDRLNFGGRFVVGKRDTNTGLTLQVSGYDAAKQKITDAGGTICLMTDSSEIAAEWSFAGLLRHWNKKHNRAAYAVAEKQEAPTRAYRYGSTVHLGVGTEFALLISAFVLGAVYYDPGIKVERASSPSPMIKRRSQFRVSSHNLPMLYRKFAAHELA